MPATQWRETDSEDSDATPSAIDQLAGSGDESAARTVAPEKARPVLPLTGLKPLAKNLTADISLPHSISLGLVSAWILLALLRVGLLMRQLLEVRRVKLSSVPAGPALQTLFESLRDSLPTRRNVQARISDAHRSAGLLGFLHPVILLPSEMGDELNQSEAEHVLRHELAHVERRDDWGNLAQQFIQAGLFFHPAVWWICARLSMEREIACDDHVLEASGRPRAYALTLANVASRMSQSGHLLAPGVFSSNSQLKQRITMILNTQRDRSPRLARRWLGFFTTATAILAVIAVAAGPRLVLAQPSPTADGTPAVLPPDTGDTSSGPRLKTSGGGANSQPAPDVAPTEAAEAPEPPEAAEPPEPPEAAEPPEPSAAPTPLAPQAVNGLPAVPPVPMTPMVAMTAPVAAPFGNTSPSPSPVLKQMTVEERLDRIERILEDLQGRGARARHRADANPASGAISGGGGWGGGGQIVAVDPFDQQSINRVAQEAKRAAEEVRRAVEAGQRAAEAGQRAAEAGQRAAEQAMRDVEKLKNKNFERKQGEWKEAEVNGSQAELEALRQARDSLQNEIRSLERQIQQIEKDRKHGKPEQNENQNDGSKDGKPAPKAS